MKLYIIGNGFDKSVGLDTSYKSLHNFYNQNKENYKIRQHKILSDKGNAVSLNDIDIVYKCIDYLDDECFWSNFEDSLGKVDAFSINLYFGKRNKDIKRLKKTINNAKRVITDVFNDWVHSINLNNADKRKYKFASDSIFINFNYTRTLEEIYGIEEERVFHIHGDVSKKNSLLFGHNFHPQYPVASFEKLGGRFRGLVAIETLLYETDKHIPINICLLYLNFIANNIDSNQISDIYVIGKSVVGVDEEYFKFLLKFTGFEIKEEKFIDTEAIDQIKLFSDYSNYVARVYGESVPESNLPEKIKFIGRSCKYWMVNEDLRHLFPFNIYQKLSKIKVFKKVKWHINVYSEDERKKVLNFLDSLGVKNDHFIEVILNK